jgi:hypothetical protein
MAGWRIIIPTGHLTRQIDENRRLSTATNQKKRHYRFIPINKCIVSFDKWKRLLLWKNVKTFKEKPAKGTANDVKKARYIKHNDTDDQLLAIILTETFSWQNGYFFRKFR